MMNRKNRIILICLLLCSILLFQWGCQFIGRTSAFSAQEQIRQTFEALGIDDAVLLEESSPFAAPLSVDDEQYLVYHSDSALMRYCFTPDSGQLAEIWHDSFFDKDLGMEDLCRDDSPALPEAELEELLLDFAARCITSHQIGELRIARKYDRGIRFYNYVVAEQYQGIETGTLVSITFIDDGTITNAGITIGSVFQTDDNGHVTPANPDPMIGEEAAIEYAMRAMAEDLPEEVDAAMSDKITCELRAEGPILAYYVTVPYLDSNGWELEYRVLLEAYTGEVVLSSHR